MPLVLCLRENEHPTLACSFMAPCSSHFGARRLRASPTYPSASPHNRGRWYSTLGLVPSFPDIRQATLPLLLRSPPRHPRPDIPHPVPTPYHMLLKYPHHPPHTPSCRPRCIVFLSFQCQAPHWIPRLPRSLRRSLFTQRSQIRSAPAFPSGATVDSAPVTDSSSIALRLLHTSHLPEAPSQTLLF